MRRLLIFAALLLAALPLRAQAAPVIDKPVKFMAGPILFSLRLADGGSLVHGGKLYYVSPRRRIFEIQRSTWDSIIASQPFLEFGQLPRGIPTPRTAGNTPTVGIDTTTAGALEVFVPDGYEIGTFKYRTSTSGCGTTSGIPTAGTTFYEPCFANASASVEQHSATSVYDAFNVPLMILKEGNPSGAASGRWDVGYSTKQRVNEDSTYIVIRTLGNQLDVLHFTGAQVGQRAVSWSFGTVEASNGEFGWMLGVHKDKLFYKKSGTNNLFVYKVTTARWCTALSADAQSDTCSSTSSTAYHTDPFTSGWGIGGNQGDIVGNKLPITRTSPTPDEVFIYDIVAKTSVQMQNVPTGSLDFCEIAADLSLVICRIDGVAGQPTQSSFIFNASTGAIQNGGNDVGSTGHAGFGILPNGTPVRLSFRDLFGNPCAAERTIRTFTSSTHTAFWSIAASPRDPQTSCADSHYSAHQTYPSPQHYLVAFDFRGDNDQVTVTAGALNAAWDNDWRALTENVAVCDYSNVAADTTKPTCRLIANTRTLNDARDCASCVNLTRDGRWVTWRAHLSTDISGSGGRTYIMRAGPLF